MAYIIQITDGHRNYWYDGNGATGPYDRYNARRFKSLEDATAAQDALRILFPRYLFTILQDEPSTEGRAEELVDLEAQRTTGAPPRDFTSKFPTSDMEVGAEDFAASSGEIDVILSRDGIQIGGTSLSLDGMAEIGKQINYFQQQTVAAYVHNWEPPVIKFKLRV